MKHEILVAPLEECLENCFLGGLINECQLFITHGKASIFAIDLSNTVIIIASKYKISTSKKFADTLGIGNIDLMLKFLDSIKEDTITAEISDNNLILRRSDGARRLFYRLTDKTLIATNFEGVNGISDHTKKRRQLLSESIYTFTITHDFIKDLQSYLGTLKTKEVTVHVTDEGYVKFICGNKNEHQFNLTNDTGVNEKPDDEYTNLFNGEYLQKILACIHDEQVNVTLTKIAMYIHQGNSTWGIGADTGE